jgi:Stage II sporulation protein M
MQTIQPNQEQGALSTGQLVGFSGLLFRHNVSVTLVAFGLGLTFGLGTAWLMFENGVLIGVLAAVFVDAGDTLGFCTGILPHGVLEIPAALLGGAGGFVLAEAMLKARAWPRGAGLGGWHCPFAGHGGLPRSGRGSGAGGPAGQRAQAGHRGGLCARFCGISSFGRMALAQGAVQGAVGAAGIVITRSVMATMWRSSSPKL